MHMDPALPTAVATLLVVVLLSLAFRRLRQPLIVAYLFAGVLLGPSGLAWWTDLASLERAGELGVLLLLFFAGMELQIPKLIESWRVPVLGTTLQVLSSVGLAFALGAAFDWPAPRSLLLGFVISLSSTAVVLNLLRARSELTTPLGIDVVGVLLAQDILVPFMLVALSLAGPGETDLAEIGLQIVGGLGIVTIVALVTRFDGGPLVTLFERLRGDREIEVFAALAVCLGVSLATSALHLSAALGAFVGGVIASESSQSEWMHQHLEPFRTLLLALFFVSVGALVDLEFLAQQAPAVGLLTVGALVTNTLLNGGILRLLGRTWTEALVGGALLSQLGEFGFVLAAVGKQGHLITSFGYQLTVATIACTLVASSLWITAVERLTSGRRAADAS
jgi:CPA2 family monovalent cation:H+ antiporter-2